MKKVIIGLVIIIPFTALIILFWNNSNENKHNEDRTEKLNDEINELKDEIDDLEIKIDDLEEQNKILELQFSMCQDKIALQKSKGTYKSLSLDGIDYFRIDGQNVIKPSIRNAIKLVSIGDYQFNNLVSNDYENSGSWNYVAKTESCCFSITKQNFLKKITFLNTQPLNINVSHELSSYNYKKFENPDFYNIYVRQKQYRLSFRINEGGTYLSLIENTPKKYF